MIKPTPGRVLWFWPGNVCPPDFCWHDRETPCAAMVAYAWSNECVNLLAVDQNGVQRPFTSVRLLQGDQEPVPGDQCAQWMPYQKQVAAGEIPPVLHANSAVETTNST